MRPVLLEKVKDLSDDNIYDKIKELLEEIGTTNYVNNNQSELMFYLHNYLKLWGREDNRSCGSCREKVYNRLKEWYNKNKKE